MKKKLNIFDKWKLEKKKKNIGKLVWTAIFYYSIFVVALFLLVTAVTFWVFVSNYVSQISGVNFNLDVMKMLFIVVISIIIIAIEVIIRKRIK